MPRESVPWQRSLELIEVHCQGEIGKVIVGGAPEIPGATMLDKMNHINAVDGSLRRFVTLEPRACAQMSVNLLTQPTRAGVNSGADAGFIVLQSDRAHAMSGSNCMCVVTAMLETGRVPMREPETIVRLDTPAGLVVARARCEHGRCVSVSLDNVAAFVEELDKTIETERWGRIKADIAFGGIYYAIVDVDQLGIAIAPENARALAKAGSALKDVVTRQVDVRHPTLPSLTDIAYVMFRSREPDGAIRTCTTLPAGRVDRSPCGTGSSANLAVLHARGEVKIGDTKTSRSIIGGEFTVQVIDVTTVAGRPAVVPRITGRAWIYGKETLRVDDSDPFPNGFALSDLWGPRIA
jgi:proline racemase